MFSLEIITQYFILCDSTNALAVSITKIVRVKIANVWRKLMLFLKQISQIDCQYDDSLHHVINKCHKKYQSWQKKLYIIGVVRVARIVRLASGFESWTELSVGRCLQESPHEERAFRGSLTDEEEERMIGVECDPVHDGWMNVGHNSSCGCFCSCSIQWGSFKRVLCNNTSS